MQTQRFSIPRATISPHSLSAPFAKACRIRTKLLIRSPNFGSEFCYSVKRASQSATNLRNGGLVGIKCEVAKEVIEDIDRFYMRRCVDLARKALGCTSPNPMVGCVIVKEGKVVGEGYHPKAGKPHAEVFALKDAGDLSENATAYVSLEPCNHYGRTPPCTEALIRAKVKRVVVGMVDPNPIVALKGVNKLRNAGIEVIVGIEEELCKRLNESYIHQMLTENPYVILRYSLSVNGQVMGMLGEGAADSGGYYSQMLQEYDAVIVSSSAMTANFPVVASQEPRANQPLWIIIANNRSSSIQVSGFPIEEASKLIVFGNKGVEVEPNVTHKGIETVVMDQISLNDILEYCKRQGFCSVLLELGQSSDGVIELLQQGIEQNLLQKVVIEVLPLWVESGGNNSPLALTNLL
ncbi:hypothetical protein UlMin_036934, partial [Ulmus minor]